MKAIEIADTIFELTIQLPQSGKIKNKTILLTKEQKYLNSLFQFGCLWQRLVLVTQLMGQIHFLGSKQF
jgi:hypothetical protein